MSTATREEAAIAAHGNATDALLAATVENINALVDRDEELRETLFVADSNAFEATQTSVIGLTDEELATCANRAAMTKNGTLASAVAGEADARGLDHLAYTALGPWPELKEAYSELKSIPSPEVRGRRIENVPEAFSMPSMERVRPTPEQYRTAGCRESRAHLRKASGRLGDRFVVVARVGRFTCVASASLPASTIVTTSGMVPGRSTRRRV